MTLTSVERRRVVAAANERQKLENGYVDELYLVVDVFLELCRDAVRRPASLVAASRSTLERVARDYINPRGGGEGVDRSEFLVIWAAVLAAASRSNSVSENLLERLTLSDLPALAFERYNDTLTSSEETGESLLAVVLATLVASRTATGTNRLNNAQGFVEGGNLYDGWVITNARKEATGAAARVIDEALAAESGFKMWASLWLDDRVRPTHLAAHTQVRPAGEPFDVGDGLLMYPGDPNGPAAEVEGCRCVLIEPEHSPHSQRHLWLP